MTTVKSKDGTEIAYTKTGTGFPLINVDGAFCSRAFGLAVEGTLLLSSNFTFISYDRRGRNESGDTKPYSVEREIEDLEALIQMAGGAAYVFGHSSGGALAVLAASSGLNIKKLALYDPPYATNGNPSPHPDAVDVLTSMISADKRSDAIEYFLQDLSGVPSFVVNGMKSSPFWKVALSMAHTLPYEAAIMGDCTFPIEEVKAIEIPVFVGGGQKTDPQSQKALKELTEILPNSTLNILEGQEHQVSMKVLAPLLTDFLL